MSFVTRRSPSPRRPSSTAAARARAFDQLFENLEPRQMFALDTPPVSGFPKVNFDGVFSGGTITYDPATKLLSTQNVQPTSVEFSNTSAAIAVQPNEFKLSAYVDASGLLPQDPAGDDFVVSGTLIDFDFNPTGQTGVLLTGEVTDFLAVDSGPGLTDDTFYFKVALTGDYSLTGLAGDYETTDVWIKLISNGSTFTGSFDDAFVGVPQGFVLPYPEEPGNFPGQISGKKFLDLQGDGKSSDDTPLGGTVIKLYADTNGNGLFDVEINDAPLATTTTAADGTYAFTTPAAAGKYLVVEQAPTGSIQTFPTASGTYSITVANISNSFPGNDFYNFKPSNISGVKYRDLTNNGLTGDDALFAGVTINLYADTNNSGAYESGVDALKATDVTDADGAYSFGGLGAGTYFVLEVVPPGYVQTYPLTAYYTVTTTPGSSTTGRDFANFLIPTPGQIDIEKYVRPVTPQSSGGQGLTPGFWKQSHHLQFWTGYTPAQNYNTVFGLTAPQADTAGLTLLGALQRGGGANNALGRHAVAALLNASNPYVDYAYTPAQVIAMVQNAYATGNFEAPKNALAVENEKGGVDLKNNPTLAPTTTPSTGFGLDADTPAAGLIAPVGSQVEFTFVVTNPGTVPIANVVVTDNNETAGTSDDFSPTPVLEGGFNVGDDDADNQLDPGENWLYTSGPKTVTAGQHTNTATVTGTPTNGAPAVTDADDANWFGNAPPPPPPPPPATGCASISGFVYLDQNNDGEIDFGEQGIKNVQIKLTNELTGAVYYDLTDAYGAYEFTRLPAGDYTIQEVAQPAGYVDGIDTPGDGSSTLPVVSNDKFSKVRIGSHGDADNWNFGERLAPGGTVQQGQTATIGFWQNKNGQALIKSLNGGSASTQLGTWLADNFPNLFGAAAGSENNLTGKSNAYVASYFVTQFKVRGLKIDAQVLAVAFAVYVTDSGTAGTVASQYGFKVDSVGVGNATFNIGTNGAAFGVANHTVLTVNQILAKTDAMSAGGWGATQFDIYNGNVTLQTLANNVYDAINNAGDI